MLSKSGVASTAAADVAAKNRPRAARLKRIVTGGFETREKKIVTVICQGKERERENTVYL